METETSSTGHGTEAKGNVAGKIKVIYLTDSEEELSELASYHGEGNWNVLVNTQ